MLPPVCDLQPHCNTCVGTNCPATLVVPLLMRCGPSATHGHIPMAARAAAAHRSSGHHVASWSPVVSSFACSTSSSSSGSDTQSCSPAGLAVADLLDVVEPLRPR